MHRSSIVFQLAFFAVIGIVAYLLDVATSPYSYYHICKYDLRTQSVHLTHHIMNMYLQFGWLSWNSWILTLYIPSVVGVLVHWEQNGNICFLTDYVNKRCGIRRGEYFRDIWKLLGLKSLEYYEKIHRIYLLVACGVAAWKIYIQMCQ